MFYLKEKFPVLYIPSLKVQIFNEKSHKIFLIDDIFKLIQLKNKAF
jgi:hypothetical protein